MKKFISGFIVGALLFSMVSVFAAVSYVAKPADFKVIVNGKEFVSDPPALEVEGRTYLPLRAMGEALGVPVNWNQELYQAEVGNAAPVAQANQYSRTNPAPLNTVQTYTRKNSNPYIDLSTVTPDYSATIRVIETIRGEKAWEKIKNANMFNEKPKEGHEYIIAKVAFTLLSSQNDTSILAYSGNFDFYSSNNEEYERTYVSLEDMLSTDLYAGGNAEGYIVGMVRTNDPAPKVAYGLDYNGTGGIWFSLTESN